MLIDTNIIVYSALPQYLVLRLFLDSIQRSVSIVSYIEALGYHGLSADAERHISEFFRASEILPLSDTIAQQAIELRRRRRIGLGDAIIAATAIAHNLTLVTHNVQDFRWIAELELLDPLIDNP